MFPDYLPTIRALFQDMPRFCQEASNRKLRSYQIAVAEAVIRSISKRLGDTIVVVFPRQSGKNELQAQIENLPVDHPLRAGCGDR